MNKVVLITGTSGGMGQSQRKLTLLPALFPENPANPQGVFAMRATVGKNSLVSSYFPNVAGGEGTGV